jgi:hypothetical protein
MVEINQSFRNERMVGGAAWLRGCARVQAPHIEAKKGMMESVHASTRKKTAQISHSPQATTYRRIEKIILENCD